MTDTTATPAEAPTEPVPPAPSEAAAAPAPDAEPETDDGRSVRQKLLDHLADTEGPQTVAQILEGTGVNRNALEQALYRATRAEQIERVAPGTYRLAPPKPPAPPKPEPPAPAVGGRTYEEWMSLMDAWLANPANWDVATLGPAPGQPGTLVPVQATIMFNRRLERREKQEAEDFKLLDQLLTACHGNYSRTAALADPRPIHVILNSGVPIEDIISTIRYKVDRRNYPKNQTIGSWSEPWFLKAVSEQYARRVLAPRWVKRWQSRFAGPPMAEAAKTAQQKAVDASEPNQPPSKKTHPRCHRRSLIAFQRWKPFPYLRRSPIRWHPVSRRAIPSLRRSPAIAFLPSRCRSRSRCRNLDRHSARPSPNRSPRRAGRRSSPASWRER